MSRLVYDASVMPRVAQMLLMLQREAVLVEEMRGAAAEFRRVQLSTLTSSINPSFVKFLYSASMNRCERCRRHVTIFIEPVLRSCLPA
jgi:hypothetical protein